MREFLFLLILTVAAACVVVGISFWSTPGAWIVAGVLLACIGWLGLAGDDEPADVGDDE